MQEIEEMTGINFKNGESLQTAGIANKEHKSSSRIEKYYNMKT